MNQIKMKKHI